MTSQSKRLVWWKGISIGELTFLLIAALFIALEVWWIIAVDHNPFGRILGTLLFTVAVLAFVLAAVLILAFRRRIVIESPCPCCGTVARRAFIEQDTRYAEPCGTCPAYLRIKGDEVLEQPLDGDDNVRYKVAPERYLPAVKDKKQTTFHFVMPQICASCGSSDATQRRTIATQNKPSSSSPSALGSLVSAAADVADVPSFSAHDYGAMGTRSQDRDRDWSGNLDIALRDLEFPVCAADVKGGSDPVQYDSGSLFFRSYRFYREFLRLNHIDGVRSR